MPKAKKKSVAGRKRGGETAPRATLPPSQAENPRADAALPPSQARKSPRARAKATSTPVGVGPSGADDQGGEFNPNIICRSRASGNDVPDISTGRRAAILWPEIIARESVPSVREQSEISLQAQSVGQASCEGNMAERTAPPVPPSVVGSPVPFMSAADPLGSEVATSLKERIWRSEFIDLALLLKQNAYARSDSGASQELGEAVFSLRQSESGLWLQFQPRAKNKGIFSVEHWTSVFLVFVSIYLEKHIERSRELIKYMDLIRHASRAFGGLGWREYDIQFRLKQARLPGRSWASVDAELWLMVVASHGPRSSAFRQQYD